MHVLTGLLLVAAAEAAEYLRFRARAHTRRNMQVQKPGGRQKAKAAPVVALPIETFQPTSWRASTAYPRMAQGRD